MEGEEMEEDDDENFRNRSRGNDNTDALKAMLNANMMGMPGATPMNTQIDEDP